MKRTKYYVLNEEKAARISNFFVYACFCLVETQTLISPMIFAEEIILVGKISLVLCKKIHLEGIDRFFVFSFHCYHFVLILSFSFFDINFIKLKVLL